MNESVKATIEVEVRPLVGLDDAYEVSVGSHHIYSGDAHRLRELGLPVPERTTAVTVHLTDDERERIKEVNASFYANEDYVEIHGPTFRKLAAAVEDTEPKETP